MLDSLLVANRGEIAVRVIRAARRLGIRSVAVYSDADRTAPHVAEADEAVRIGPAPAAESYLSIDAVLAAAERSGAGGVHPGYGFLSENAAFAAACERAGLVFVGPQPEVIELMSRKDRAREAARSVGAAVVPAVEVADLDVLAERVAAEVGYPALVKAVAGGGGKGMRVVRRPAELEEALAGAGREAAGAFGDATLLVERYLPEGRHLEVQVVGDGIGKVVHLLDRDCSVQRRHQKVVEEAPASTVAAAARERALEAAVALAGSVRYRSLGTVEFLAVGGEAYFLEMNTRLQVEHPVTELVTGIDLVELQLRLAAGEPLALAQDEVVERAHAIEARLYAEDADGGFLPQSGTAGAVHWPAAARVDAALEPGQEVGTDYDPMLAKIVVSAPTREAARRLLVDALDETAIFGVTTNVGFLRRLVASDRFARAEIHTSWLDTHAGELARPDVEPALAAAAAYLAEAGRRSARSDPFGADGWRSAADAAPVVVELGSGGRRRRLSVAGDLGVSEDGRSLGLAAVTVGADGVTGDAAGRRERFLVWRDGAAAALHVAHRGTVHRFDLASTGPAHRAHGGGQDVIEAPLPGLLAEVRVEVGAHVGAGEVVGVLESMKMEYPLRAGREGRVLRVSQPAGVRVARGDLLFELEPVGPEGQEEGEP